MSFNWDRKKWNTYIARVNQFFIANEIKKEAKVPILITLVGDETYELMVDLHDPVKPELKTYEQLVELVQNHLEPKPSIYAERHKFRLRRQEETESIANYVAALKSLAKTCEFKQNLEENLRDQLVYGLKSDIIKQKLFSEKDMV
ncbi:hypothetical protein QE152_g22275 [Popillia japonica]|uniref:Retrotransposon gag domain-containing protein n=1 Tax=Popillia japonica TaxID=7064 RepID=A0AAW1KKT0_POPJA